MTQLINTEDSSIVGKFIYMKRSNKEMDIHYIFDIKEILGTSPVKYKVGKCFYFCIPFDKDRRCFYYNTTTNIKLNSSDILYELSYDEWLNTFHSFIKNEGKCVKELPSKIIKDI